MNYSKGCYSGLALRLSLRFCKLLLQTACLHKHVAADYSCHGNKLFSFTEFGSIVVIVENLMLILPWVREKFIFTVSKFDECYL